MSRARAGRRHQAESPITVGLRLVSAAAQLLVCARRKSDIKQVFPGHPIKETRHTDYRYRTTVPRHVVADTIANRILAIDYDNFKNSVEDHDLHAAYARVWGIMYALQQGS
ncbi:hypothetical protein [Hydrogenophilus thermoluteolus]|uniref:hypothetical protein n=1 Tax=Hydrogenophilus thermoluteolus TaxID=297 RepID=UPI000E659A1C|nr:hypothetical protein [Hydrogenophilus thermoluteolus]